MEVIGFPSSYTAEANKDIVPFGDIELQNHEPGYFVHIERKMDKNYETSLVSLMPPWCSKVKIVDLHRDYNSSAKHQLVQQKKCQGIDVVYYLLFSTLFVNTNQRINAVLWISSIPESSKIEMRVMK